MLECNELYHYSVLGMKWGVRRNSSGGRSGGVGAKLKKRYDQKQEKKTEELQKDTDRYGVGGVAVGRYAGYKAKHHIRGHLANAINAVADVGKAAIYSSKKKRET